MRATFGSLRQLLLAWTVAMMVLITVSGQGDKVQLFFKSPFCKYDNRTQDLLCDLSNQTKRDAELAEATWDEIRTTEVIGAKSLLIKPQSKAESKELHVINCQEVNTEKVIDADRVRLHMRQSSADTITSVANLLRAHSSEIRTVDLDPVSQFDFADCKVHSLTLRATNSKCSIIGSEIHLIKSMVLEGAFKFEVENSTMTDIKYLHYNSNYMSSTVTNVTIHNVQESGLVVSKGVIMLKFVTIDNLDSKAIRIEDEGNLQVEQSVITHASVDSLIMNGGKVHFREVTIGDQSNVSFVISGASGDLQPFAIVYRGPSTVKWIVISVVIGLILGVIICGVLYIFLVYRKGRLKSDDREGMKLLANNKTKPTTEPSPYSPQPQKDKEKEVDELYEDYIDVDVDGAPPPPKDINLLPSTQPPRLPDHQQQGKNTDEDELYEEYVDVNVDSGSSSLSKKATDPSSSINHRPPQKNQEPPTTNPPPIIINHPSLPQNANLPDLSSAKASPGSPHTGLPLQNLRPAGRAPPPPPERKESVKNKLPSPSSSLSDERDGTGTVPKSAKPQVPPGKPSFLHMIGDRAQPSSNPVKKSGAPGEFSGRPPLPSKPAPPPASQKPSTLSTEDEDDIYDTLDEN